LRYEEWETNVPKVITEDEPAYDTKICISDADASASRELDDLLRNVPIPTS
jgi:hypothetical protein